MENIINYIKNNYKSFSKMHRKFSDYILNKSEKAVDLPLSKLAEESQVSEATIVRFTHVLGLKGYREFQEELKNSIKYSISTIDRIKSNTNLATTEVIKKQVETDISNIVSTYSDDSYKNIYTAAKMIDKSNNIYILGLRTSNVLSQYLAHYLKMMEFSVIVIEATLMEPFEQLAKMKNDDILISFSFPRYSQKTIRSTYMVYRQNYPVIAITDSEDATISEISTVSLIAKMGMTSFIDSLVAPLTLINSLLIAISTITEKNIKETFTKLENYWELADTYEKI